MEYGQADSPLRVLDNLNFSMDGGDTVAIVGPSGSGKTTLLQLLAALEQPTHGSIQLDGQALSHLSPDELADFRRDNMGIVFQSFHLIDSLTALANAALPLDIAGQADSTKRAINMLERVGLKDRTTHYPQQLSGGEQQRVAIARALVHEPRLILADEPTGNLDEKTGKRVADMLFDLHAQSQSTLVLVTHDMRLAQRCKRLFWLESGKLRVEENSEFSA
ncbi:ABC transporter ATP-binding protein [Aestuariibacter sp. P117]|uniref:ABC transporter ATP-binding protein n=2 Tax=Glaciecola petra TaxID=3075602 RepID=A0ABU2ZQU8_9ALTE|nr:ABC transporter ATP-binding protein [Aestuariibacter sp. P117]MDT0595008.1 ABC transporter ATP-binding protein [Aestuariibacter sp. P117]